MEIRNFEEFWPYYMGEHRDPVCRALHYIGTSAAIVIVLSSIVTMNPLLLAAFPVVGYGFAWFGHFFIEKNKPASFKYPLWSFLADHKMLAYFVSGRMGSELARLQKSNFRSAASPA
jgi:hypothetical protein